MADVAASVGRAVRIKDDPSLRDRLLLHLHDGPITLSLSALLVGVFFIIQSRLAENVEFALFALRGWADPHILSPLTSTIAHKGLVHMAGNAVLLFLFGVSLERRVSDWIYVPLFFVAGAATGLAQVKMAGGSAVGASGAVAMVMATWFAFEFPQSKLVGLLGERMPGEQIDWSKVGVGFVVVFALVSGLLAVAKKIPEIQPFLAALGQGRIGHSAHFVGLFVGISVVSVIRVREGELRLPRWRIPPAVPVGAGSLLFAVGLAWTMLVSAAQGLALVSLGFALGLGGWALVVQWRSERFNFLEANQDLYDLRQPLSDPESEEAGQIEWITWETTIVARRAHLAGKAASPSDRRDFLGNLAYLVEFASPAIVRFDRRGYRRFDHLLRACDRVACWKEALGPGGEEVLEALSPHLGEPAEGEDLPSYVENRLTAIEDVRTEGRYGEGFDREYLRSLL